MLATYREIYYQFLIVALVYTVSVQQFLISQRLFDDT